MPSNNTVGERGGGEDKGESGEERVEEVEEEEGEEAGADRM